MPGAPLAEAVAAALRGSSSDLEAREGSSTGFELTDADPVFTEDPESGFSSMRTRY